VVDYSLPAGAPLGSPRPPTSLRPSRIDALKSAASGPTATVAALVTALTGLIAAAQSWTESQATARAAYETLRIASDRNTVQIEACRESQLQQTRWIEELSARIERRQASTEKAIKQSKPPASIPKPVIDPAPKPPAPPAPVETPVLPPFDGLTLRDKTAP